MTSLRRASASLTSAAVLALGLGACGDDKPESIPTPAAAAGDAGPVVADDVDIGENVDAANPGDLERAQVRAVEVAGGGEVVSVDFDMDADGSEDEDGDTLTRDAWTVVVEEDGEKTRVVLDRSMETVFLETVD